MTYIKNSWDFLTILISIFAIFSIFLLSLVASCFFSLFFYFNEKKLNFKDKLMFLEKEKFMFMSNFISKIKSLEIRSSLEDILLMILYTSLVLFGSLSKFIVFFVCTVIFIYTLGLLNFISLSIGILICILYVRMYQIIKNNNDKGLSFFELYRWNKKDFNDIKDILFVLLGCMYFFIILTSNVFNQYINSIFSFLFILNLIFVFIVLNKPFKKNLKN